MTLLIEDSNLTFRGVWQSVVDSFSVTNKERFGGKLIPMSSHLDDHTIRTTGGDLLRIWRIGGINFETADDEDLQVRLDALNNMYRSLGSPQIAIWVHNVRRCVSDRLVADFENEFCRELDKKYYDSFVGYRMMANELYLTLIYRPFPSKVVRAASRAGKRSKDDIRAEETEALRCIEDQSRMVQHSLNRYDPEPLGVYEEKGIQYSSALEFLAYLVNGFWQKVRRPAGPIYEYLQTSRPFFGSEMMELRAPAQSRYAAMIDFKDYPDGSGAGMLNQLLRENFEFTLTQSFSPMSKYDARKFLERQRNQLMNSEDTAVSQVDEMEDALDDLGSGRMCMGEYHSSLLIFAENEKQLRDNVASTTTTLQEDGFMVSRTDKALIAGFWAQLPCNWTYRPRQARLTSLNFSGLASLHNFATGKRDGNPWGQAVTLLKTPSGQPFYFNFHSTKEEEDSEDQKVLGNTKIIGQSGAGKTVLLNFLLAQSQKFKPTCCFFDKDRGAEIAIRAYGGKYLAIEDGKPTGFNPFQLDATESNILFLEHGVRVLATEGGRTLTPKDEGDISNAVRAVMKMPREIRRLSLIRQNLPNSGDGNSVSERLKKWCGSGPFGWVWDNPSDQLDFTTHSLMGFDGTAFLDNASVRTPIAMYLLHRMESIIDGRRFMYFMDEFWKWLKDEAFREFAYNKQKTIRKQNGLGAFATQSPDEVLKSDIARAIIEQCATDIYLPNPKADRDEYVDGFKISEREFDIVRTLGDDSRMFLVKQGHRSAIARLDLGGFEDELLVLSGSLDNVALLDEIRAVTGDDPKAWLPVLKAQIADRKKRISHKEQS